jgi:hypothetical protein
MAQRSSRRARTSAQKAGEAAAAIRENPYVQRLIEDDDLRDDIRGAYESARHAYGRMSNGKGPAKALMDDKKVQRDLRQAAESLRDASERLRGKRRRRGGGLKRLLLVGIVGGILILALSEGARKALLDRLFGPEEEFEYTSTTTVTSEPAAQTAS